MSINIHIFIVQASIYELESQFGQLVKGAPTPPTQTPTQKLVMVAMEY